jgi:hypothetical protein
MSIRGENHAKTLLLAAAKASLAAWESEEQYTRAKHRDTIDDLHLAILYFETHGNARREEESL